MNDLQYNLNQNSYTFIQENASENIVSKIAAILSRPQCFKQSPYWCATYADGTFRMELLMVFGSFFGNIHYGHDINFWALVYLRARFMGPTSGPSGAGNTQVGPMLAPWTLLSVYGIHQLFHITGNKFRDSKYPEYVYYGLLYYERLSKTTHCF